MPHHDSLILMLVAGFVLAFVFGMVAVRFKLSPLFGYLLAGVAVGPFTPGFVADAELAPQLAEIGVILLMFGVGLHFSPQDLMRVRKIAIPGALAQIAAATLLGWGVGRLMGLGDAEALLLGFALSVASTVVLIKALEQRGQMKSEVGGIATGWLIVEDLVIVIALVLLPLLVSATGESFDALALAGSVGWTLLKVAAFVAIMFVVGGRVLPWLLVLIAHTRSRELFTLGVLAIALGIAWVAYAVFGASFALGAFVAGLVLNGTPLGHNAAEKSLPLRDAFSVLFFVSVGMLFDPSVLLREPGKVLGALALIMIGKSVIAFVIVAALRYPIGLGLTVAASLAQIGEFSFILAGLGISLGLLSREGQDLILAAAILSILLNPLAFMASDALQKIVRVKWPALWAGYGQRHSEALEGELQRIRELSEEREAQHQIEMHKLIQTFPLFAGVDEHSLEELLLLFKPSSASPGDRVVRKGERGDAMYFIAAGAVEVKLDNRSIRLEAGSFFGEMALLSGERRIADVVAVDFCEFLVLKSRDFNRFVSKHPELKEAVSTMASQRRKTNTAPAEAE